MTAGAYAAQRQVVRQAVSSIKPFDLLEQLHQADALDWINSDATLCRWQKPDKPPQHLVVYGVVLSPDAGQVLLVDHHQAQKWLPPGGHVEAGENPAVTVERELGEELRLSAHWWPGLSQRPLFVIRTITVGLTAGHTDVTLWYAVTAPMDEALWFDTAEFRSVRWFGARDLAGLEPSQYEPHLLRFMSKHQALRSIG